MNQAYFIFILLYTLHLSAQENPILIQGLIMHDSTALENVHVVNKATNKGALSNDRGEFQMFAKENDTLLFSSIQFVTKKLIINKEHLKNKALKIHLSQKNNVLKEIVLENMAKSLGLPNADKTPLKPTERKLNYIKKGGNLDKIYAWISGNKKSLKILQKHLDEDDKIIETNLNIQMIRNHFTDAFFINTLKIPKENIDGLINFCLPKGIVFVFERERYLEVIDLLIQHKDSYLSSLR